MINYVSKLKSYERRTYILTQYPARDCLTQQQKCQKLYIYIYIYISDGPKNTQMAEKPLSVKKNFEILH